MKLRQKKKEGKREKYNKKIIKVKRKKKNR